MEDKDRLEDRRQLGTTTTKRWGRALAPWISWSADGRRALFSQGGTLFLGTARPNRWTNFGRIEVPLDVPVDVPRGTLVLRGARLITMRGREIIEKGDIIVADGRITAVAHTGQVPLPENALLMDVNGTTILPGYVDLHDHMWLPKGVHPQQAWQCLVRLAFGVTAVRDPQPGLGIDVFTYRERERTGELLCPRVFTTGMAYFGSDRPLQTLVEALDVVMPNSQYFDTGTFKLHHDPIGGRRARQLIAIAASQAGLNSTIHSNSLELSLTGVIDGFSGIEHAPRAIVYEDVAELIARSGTVYTHTYGCCAQQGAWNYMIRRHGEPDEWLKMRRFAGPAAGKDDLLVPNTGVPELDNLVSLVSGAVRIVAKGGRVGIGSHGDIPGLGYHYEMWLHALGGMPNHEILRSATLVGATALGHGTDIGSLDEGKLADLQILEENPLADIRHTTKIRYVMKNGRLYDAKDLTQVWPSQTSLAAIYLWADQ